MNGSVRVGVQVLRGDGGQSRLDDVVEEEPLEIRVEDPDGTEHRVAVTMRTPGHDLELAIGFLFAEGLLSSRDQIAQAPRAKLRIAPARENVVLVPLTTPFDPTVLQRNFFATSSCGVCGKAALEQVERSVAPLDDRTVFQRPVLQALPTKLRAAQELFERTGGLHGSGLFSRDGELLCVREDVGRHNAVDKIVGRALLDGGLPLRECVLLVSGRIGFEIAQKAAVAGIPLLCGVSAPSSLAVRTAEKVRMTLVGFLRGDSMNVYSAPHRVASD